MCAEKWSPRLTPTSRSTLSHSRNDSVPMAEPAMLYVFCAFSTLLSTESMCSRSIFSTLPCTPNLGDALGTRHKRDSSRPMPCDDIKSDKTRQGEGRVNFELSTLWEKCSTVS